MAGNGNEGKSATSFNHIRSDLIVGRDSFAALQTTGLHSGHPRQKPQTILQ